MKLKTMTTILCLAASLALTACKSEKQLVVDASAFANDLGGQYSVVKAVSLQYGYAVFMNNNSGKYMAIKLSNWNPALTSASAHLDAETQSGRVYFNLKSQSGGDFKDYDSGIVFEGSEAISKDGQTEAGFVEQLNIEAAKNNLVEMGVPSDRAATIATLAVASAKKEELNADDVNAILEVVGDTSLSEIASTSSNPLAAHQLIEKAAAKNNMSAEQMKELVNKIFE